MHFDYVASSSIDTEYGEEDIPKPNHKVAFNCLAETWTAARNGPNRVGVTARLAPFTDLLARGLQDYV